MKNKLNPKNEYALKVVEAFGGLTALAEVCKISPAAVSQWKNNGVPQYRLDYLRLLRPDIFKKLDRKPRKKRNGNS